MPQNIVLLQQQNSQALLTSFFFFSFSPPHLIFVLWLSLLFACVCVGGRGGCGELNTWQARNDQRSKKQRKKPPWRQAKKNEKAAGCEASLHTTTKQTRSTRRAQQHGNKTANGWKGGKKERTSSFLQQCNATQSKSPNTSQTCVWEVRCSTPTNSKGAHKAV